MNRDRHHTAKRQAANMRVGDPQRVHRGQQLVVVRPAGDFRRQATFAGERPRERFDQGLPVAVEARYFGGPDGVLRVRETLPARGGGEIVLEGEQLSRRVLQPPP